MHFNKVLYALGLAEEDTASIGSNARSPTHGVILQEHVGEARAVILPLYIYKRYGLYRRWQDSDHQLARTSPYGQRPAPHQFSPRQAVLDAGLRLYSISTHGVAWVNVASQRSGWHISLAVK